MPRAEQPDDIEARLAAVEREQSWLREQIATAVADAAAARVLASGADRDVSEVRAELRAHTQALNALRETQVEQGRRMTTLERRVADMDQRMTQGFATLNTGMQHITALLEGLTAGDSDRVIDSNLQGHRVLSGCVARPHRG